MKQFTTKGTAALLMILALLLSACGGTPAGTGTTGTGGGTQATTGAVAREPTEAATEPAATEAETETTDAVETTTAGATGATTATAGAAAGGELGTDDNPIVMSFVPSGDTQEIIASGEEIAEMITEKTGLAVEANVATSYAAVV